MAKVYLGIGGNIGNTQACFLQAFAKLNTYGVHVQRVSDFIRSKPYGGVVQKDFLNAVIEVCTEHSPYELLKILKQIELELGREQSVRWGPRCIDLDILLYDDLRLNSETLTIPHKDMHNRDFVLLPLRQLLANSRNNKYY